MNFSQGIIEKDVHGMNVEEAVKCIESTVRKADAGIYRIRIIHGYHRGNGIMQAIREEFAYGREPAVKRIVAGDNPGITELVLREY